MLRIGASSAALVMALAAVPAFAQTDPNQNGTTPQPGSDARNADVTGNQADPNQNPAVPTSGSATTQNAGETSATNDDVVVTGTMFRRTNTETPSPVTTLTAQNLEQRGLTTIASAVNSIAAGNGGNLPQNFTANGAFAGGAQGVSLRGLTTDSTLVLFDGLRASYYPLADDGARSFVDLNTIPDAIVDRVEVLRDGASATYGADAVAGVVNVILKKEITGLQGRVEGGISERGDLGDQRVQLTAGYGKLDEQGYNVYISGEYDHTEELFARDRPFPYNTQNLTSIGGVNGDAGSAGVGATTSAVVRPATTTAAGILSGSAISLANGGSTSILGGTCQSNTVAHTTSAGSFCEQDLVNQYGVIAPEQSRYGGTVHVTANIGDKAQAYIAGTFYESDVYVDGTPTTVRSTNPIYTANIVLPALLSNGTVNPYDPYANIIASNGQRESALLYYRFGDIPVSTLYKNKSYRFASGIDGTFGDGFGYSIAGTYMKDDLSVTRKGAISLAGLTQAINTGAYNFINPSSNSQAVRDLISPTYTVKASTQIAQVQGTVTKALFQLPGGPLQIGVGGQFRWEDINDPSQDPGLAYIGINTFQAIGHRYVTAGYFEINAPILDQLEIDGSGRYDHYSEGFNHFSPKIGAKFTPIPQLAIRGTFSTGFRAPSIPETSGAVIGYVTYTPPASVIAAHGNDAYVQPYSLGLYSAGNPNLKPETARNFTGGIVLQPKSWISLTVDYYNIRKKNLILQGSGSALVANNYLATGVLPANTTVTLNPVDPQYPNLPATVATVNSLYYNATSLKTSGIDAQIQATIPITPGVKFTTILEGTEILQYRIDNGDGTVYNYVGTLGSYNITSASGTPRWRANWQNTIEAGPLTVTGTGYFTSGYYGYADDYLGSGSCDYAVERAANSSALQCYVKHFLDVDLSASVKINKQLTFYGNVVNLFDVSAPFDPNTYGGVNYNPAWSTAGVIGRYYRAGATFKF